MVTAIEGIPVSNDVDFVRELATIKQRPDQSFKLTLLAGSGRIDAVVDWAATGADERAIPTSMTVASEVPATGEIELGLIVDKPPGASLNNDVEPPRLPTMPGTAAEEVVEAAQLAFTLTDAMIESPVKLENLAGLTAPAPAPTKAPAPAPVPPPAPLLPPPPPPPVTAVPVLVCVNCGTPKATGAGFCHGCGSAA